MVLRSVFRTPSGAVALTDAMPLGQREREHRIGRDSPHVIIRVVEGLEGEVEMELDFQPRPEYGLTTPMLLPHPGGLRTRGGPRAYVLASEIPVEAEDGSARARFVVRPGRKVAFALRACSPWGDVEAAWTTDETLGSSKRRSRRGDRGRGCTRDMRARIDRWSDTAAGFCKR